MALMTPTPRAPLIEQPEPSGCGPESGVIRDAKRRRRRERIAASLLFLSVIGAVLFLIGHDNGATASARDSSRPHWLAGAPLRKPTHLRLLVSQNGGPPSIVDVDSGRVLAVPGLGLPRKHRLWSPMLWPLVNVPGGALGLVTRRACDRCAGSETHFLITASGSVRRIDSLRLARDQSSTIPALGSTSASWVLTHPRHGPCTVRVEPGAAAAVQVPCGTLLGEAMLETGTGLIILAGDREILIDPRTGRILARSPLNGQLDVLSRSTVLIGAALQDQIEPRPSLTLLNLTTGTRRRLRWPSTLRFGYEVLRDPGTSLVAIDFADPAYDMTGRQASDVWLLDPRTGAFSHVPGFPIFEYLKVSGMAWTADRRLVIVAYGPHRPSIAIWRPGARNLQVGPVPALRWYLQFVPFLRQPATG
jgi:hypothetical protein